MYRVAPQVIRNRGTSGKKKYLMMLPGRLAPVEGGTIGTIEKLDTPNPELLLHWPGKGKLQVWVGRVVSGRQALNACLPECMTLGWGRR